MPPKPLKHPGSSEYVYRLRYPGGMVKLEITFYIGTDNCYSVWYWPNGKIQSHCDMTLDQLHALVTTARETAQ